MTQRFLIIAWPKDHEEDLEQAACDLQDVEDGFFWMPSGLVYGTRHPVVGPIRWGK